MKLEDLRLIEARTFSLGKKHAGELEYHGKTGYFKIFTPKTPPWSEEENLRLLTILTDAAEKTSNSLRKLGFKRQVHNVAIVGDNLGKNNLVAGYRVAGRASDKGHGIVIGKSYVTTSFAPTVLAHEWGHRYWFQLTKEEQKKVEDLYEEMIIGPFVEEDTWKNIDKKLEIHWHQSLRSFATSELEINDLWIDEKPKADEDPKITYLRGLKRGSIINGIVKRPIPNVAVFKDDGSRFVIKGDTTLEPGDTVVVELIGNMWQVTESKAYGLVNSRYLSPKMVHELIDFKPDPKSWAAIEAIRKDGNIVLIKQMPESTWKIIARNAIVNIMGMVPNGEFSSDLEDRAEGLLEGGLQATLDAWWKKLNPTKGKAPKDLRGVFLALKKVLKERLEIGPFLKYQATITKKRMGMKIGNVRRQKLQKQGTTHSAYGASNPSEFWATMVEHGAMGKPLEPRVAKLLKTLGR